MGAEQLSKDWSHQYYKPNQKQPNATNFLLKHKHTQQKFQLITICTNDEPEKIKLHQRFKKRQAIKPKFIRHLQDIYFKEEDQFCGSINKFQLIYEFVQCRLYQHFNNRLQKKLIFQDQEIFYLLLNICHALKEIQLLNDRHGQISMQSIIISSQIKLQDPIVIESAQKDGFQSSNSKPVSYPSPNALMNRIDSGINMDHFREDLFSLGMVALQLCFPYQNIKKVYKNKSTKYQNERIDFDSLYQYLQRVNNPIMRECLNALLSQLPNERTKIYELLQNIQISKANLFCINQNSKVVTHEEQLAIIFNPYKQTSIKNLNYPRPYFTQRKAKDSAVKEAPILTNHKNTRPLQIEVNHPKVVPSVSFKIQAKNVPKYENSVQIVNFNSPIPINKRPNFHYSQNFINSQTFAPTQYQNIAVNHKVNVPINQTISFVVKENGKKAIDNTLRVQPEHSTEIVRKNKKQESFINPSTIETKKDEKQKSAQKEMIQISTTPIKNLAQLISPFKQLKEDFHNPIENKENHHKEDTDKRRRSSNKNLQALQQQFAELQKIAAKNEQLQKKLHFQANNIFNQKQSVPIHQEVIVQDNLEDSRNDEPELVLQEYQSGHKYEGYVQNKKRNGFGKFYYNGGSVYQGQWVDNKMCGYGMLFYPNGTIAYQGFWSNDEFDGKGTLKNDVFYQFEGNFDYKNFKSIKNFQWKIYDGQWRKDKKQGKGKLTLSNGQFYEGEFKNDMPHGNGLFKQLKGNKINGIWFQGTLKTIME